VCEIATAVELKTLEGKNGYLAEESCKTRSFVICILYLILLGLSTKTEWQTVHKMEITDAITSLRPLLGLVEEEENKNLARQGAITFE
jgi:hypothetical protein